MGRAVPRARSPARRGDPLAVRRPRGGRSGAVRAPPVVPVARTEPARPVHAAAVRPDVDARRVRDRERRCPLGEFHAAGSARRLRTEGCRSLACALRRPARRERIPRARAGRRALAGCDRGVLRAQPGRCDERRLRVRRGAAGRPRRERGRGPCTRPALLLSARGVHAARRASAARARRRGGRGDRAVRRPPWLHGGERANSAGRGRQDAQPVLRARAADRRGRGGNADPARGRPGDGDLQRSGAKRGPRGPSRPRGARDPAPGRGSDRFRGRPAVRDRHQHRSGTRRQHRQRDLLQLHGDRGYDEPRSSADRSRGRRRGRARPRDRRGHPPRSAADLATRTGAEGKSRTGRGVRAEELRG